MCEWNQEDCGLTGSSSQSSPLLGPAIAKLKLNRPANQHNSGYWRAPYTADNPGQSRHLGTRDLLKAAERAPCSQVPCRNQELEGMQSRAWGFFWTKYKTPKSPLSENQFINENMTPHWLVRRTNTVHKHFTTPKRPEVWQKSLASFRQSNFIVKES